MAIQVGDTGKTLSWNAGYVITGWTVTMTVIDFQGTKQTLTMAVDGGGTSASRSSLVTDFPTAGEAKFQFKATNGVKTYRSPQTVRNIGVKLD